MAKIDALFDIMLESGASDMHLCTGSKPKLRTHGELEEMDHAVLTDESLREILFEIANEEQQEKFLKTKDLDFAYEIPDVSRFRANYFFQKFGMGAVFRVIPTKILTIEDLNLPDQILKLTKLSRGLVLVTGPTGSGKSTTLAAIIDYINANRKDHILTVEDPIEFVHKSKGCLVNHREVGSHTESFAAALRAALREDPGRNSCRGNERLGNH